jgi:hypothetical protein
VLLASIAIALVLGVGIGLRLASATPTAITLAGSETDTVTGASMSVTVQGGDVSSHVSAIINGLRPGVAYKLIAMDSSGQTQILIRWVAEDKPYTYTGDATVRGDKLSWLTVAQLDGAVVITVKVAKSSPAAGRAQPTRRAA